MTFQLILNGRRITPADLNDNDAATFSPDERYTLHFCHQWLTGQESFVVPTSGSTGKPKAITLTRAQMCASAWLTGRALGLTAINLRSPFIPLARLRESSWG